ncbi:MAG TPA: TetR/AcrR family transcriptional regulator [Bryobacteraceae bacterium]|nr:TetR/AcrR family transcriptional regulator [Bryobacteraceae bacterium]
MLDTGQKIDTKQRILDTAERLIGEQGYTGTSLRQIISEAGVNLAAVHYHFGSKEDLLDELILRKAKPVNEQREALLNQLEEAAGAGPVAVDQLLAAFFQPMADVGGRYPNFVRLMGRMYAEGMLAAVLRKHFQPTILRFVAALRRALPELPENELFSRLQFMIGAMSHAVCGPPVFPGILGQEGALPDFGVLIRRLMVFLDAGFRAPATPEVP